ncbi:hypothetical protein FB45DRAFT_1019886 [Roridomyces roridus]|uniref:Uncharacterized protein n=1 Tax=Roridomyces roridus TaxID=1738132 RepID=A0AAD7CFX2_9AGAR|nr:hypothetical protein FB45DRAFT_1019886 [Roridomyces roridus]
MDAASLSSLSRSEIIALAKANKIKANLSTKEIIRQLLEQFPDGVPALSVEDAPVPKRKKFMGRVKDALKAVTGTIKRESPSSEQTAIHNVPNSPLTQRPHSPSDVDSDNEEGTVDDHVEAADPEDIRLVVADMSAISARNKENLARASALRSASLGG